MITLKVKDVDIASGGSYIAIINQEDARKLDLFALDRIKIKKGRKEVIAAVDIAESEKAVPKGQIGLFEEILDVLNIKNGARGAYVQISFVEKPESVSYIKKKLDGKHLEENEIRAIIQDIVNNNLSQIEISFFVSGCYTKGLDTDETLNLIKAIVETGGQLDTGKVIVMDKHCSGGVPNNRTTMLIVPIVAAAGITIPKTSSRSITSPAGTADTMEVLAPVTLPIQKMKSVIKKTNGCIVWGGSMSLAAADDKMIKIRYPLSLDPTGLLLASIISKKRAVHASHVLIDLPIGNHTKIKTRHQAEILKKEFLSIGREINMKMKVIFTDGSQPIGNGVGPLLEARDVLWILKGDKKGPDDLRKKALFMAKELLEMAGMKNAGKTAKDILDSGKAFSKMVEIVEAQGGKMQNPDMMRLADFSFEAKAAKSGKVRHINNLFISKVARIAGAPQDKDAGLYIYKHVGAKVQKGEPLYTVYSCSKEKLHHAVRFAKSNEVYGID